MKHFTPTPRSRNARAFLASLLSYLLIVGQLAPVALAADGSAMRAAPPEAAGEARGGEGQRLGAAPAPAPLAAPAAGPVIGASKIDIFNDADGDMKADPGQDINYEVTVSNTGDADATNVEFTDPIDSNVALDTTSVTMSPLARDDSYTAIVGSQLVVNAAAGVLANDGGLPAPTATAIASGATTKGGTVTLDTNGSFTYDPPAGAFSGADSFTYTAVNGNAPPNASDATGTVTISFDPAAVDDSPTVAEDAAPTTIDVLANDTDPDGGAKTIDTVTQPANGTVVITNSGSDLTYEPDDDYCNSEAGGTPDTFTYKLTPGGDEATVSVNVTCSNDAPTDISLSNDTVAENSASGTAVGNFTSTDPEAADTHTYSLVAGTGDTDNASFQIVGDQLQTAAPLDFEAKSSYSIRVRSTDSGSATYDEVFTVTATNVNEGPTDIAISNASVGENMPSGTAVGNLSTTDPDGGDTHTYSLVAGTGDGDNASFQIVGNQLQTNASFDFETDSSYSVRVRSTDASSLFHEKAFTITITNTNEAPTDISLSNDTVAENSPSATLVGNLSTTDPDAGDSFTYSLVAGTGDADNASFQISGGQLQTNASFDFETDSSYSVRVRSTDTGGAFFEEAFTITITDVNEGPTLTAGGATPTFTEDGPAVAVDPGLTVADVDSTDIQSATVQITGNYQNGQDVLAFANTPNITGSFDALTGTLTLTGTDTLANYQAALRTVTYNNTSQNPVTTSRAVSFKAKDSGGADSNTAVTNVTVVAVNDAPVVTAGATLAYTENDASTNIDGTITVADVDDTNIESATVQITANYVNGQDVLSFINTPNITGLFDPTSGTLTLTGSDTLANYQTALRNVKYHNNSDDPTTAARTVTWQVNDGGPVNATSALVTSTINVTAVNDKPTANGFTNLPAQAGIAITYPAGKLGGTDVEAGTTITINTTPDTLCTGCLLTINANGSFTFIPPPSAAGTTVGFTYHVSDNGNPAPGVDSDPATVSFAVAGPEIYFVKTAAVGAGNCTLGNECTLTTALANIGSRTNTRIFIEDAGSYTNAVTLNDGGWLIGQGVNVAFDTLFGIGAPAQGTLAPRPTTNLARPTLDGAGATVTAHNSSAVRGLNIDVDAGSNAGLVASNRTGTLVFSELNVTSAAGNAIDLLNTSASFLGPHVINSTSGNGLEATGGGTVTVAGTTNTITSTTGTALNINGTAIGAADVTFQKISSNGGGNPGIVLSNTGSAGSLVVTGNGGTCSTALNCTGGAIINKTSAGVSLNSTTDVSLTRMFLDNNDGSGVSGTSVTGFSLANSVVTNNDNGVADGAQAGLRFTNLHGTSSVSSTLFQNQTEDHVRITNTGSGSPNLNLSVTNSTFNINSATTGGHGIALIGTNNANMTLSVTNSTFDDILSTAVIMNLSNTARGNYTVSNNSFTDIGAAITLGTADSSDLIFNVSNNTTMLRATSNMIQLVAGSNSLPASQIRGTISGNSIGNGTVGSGHVGQPLPVQYGIAVDLRGDQDAIIDILSNTTRNTEWEGIWVSAADFGSNPGSPTTDITVRDNSVTQIDDDGDGPGGDADFPRNDIRGVLVDYRHTTNGCLDLFSNTSVGSPGAPAFKHFRVRQRDTATVRVERLTDGDGTPNELLNNAATIEANLAAQNDPGSTVEATFVTGFTEAADGACRPTSTGISGPVVFSESLAPEAPQKGQAALDGGADKPFVMPTAGEDIWSEDGTQLLRPAREGRESVTPPSKRGVVTPWQPDATPSAPAETTAPAASPAPARVWSDMPVVIMPAPRTNPAPESDEAEKAEGDEDGEADDEAKESDSAVTPQPAAPKSRVKRTETYRPKQENTPAQPEQSQPEPPSFRNISYVGPLGSAPSRAPRFARASYSAASGERGLKTVRAAHAVKSTTKAARAAKASAAPLAAPAAACAPSATLVCVQVGTLPAGKAVAIRFKVTVDNPFTGAVEQVENQGTVSYTEGASVLTDDPVPGGAADKTVTPVAAPPDIVVHNASVPEPKSGSTNMAFTITLSRNPPADVVVNFTTEDETPAGTGKAVAGSDYTATSGQFTFAPGQRVMTVSVPVLHNAPVEPDETFKLKLTSATGGSITDGEATGTITQIATPGTVLISEVRTSGPDGLGDDFVEIYNNSGSAVVVPAGGWGLFKMGANCDATPVLVGVVPAGTIPVRGHFLFVGSQYSLEDYGGSGAAGGDAPLIEDIESDRNLALFSTTDLALLSSETRLDAVGFGTNNQGNCNLLREGNILGAAGGSALEHSYFRKLCGFVNGQGCQTNGTPLDTQDNAADFTFADTTGTAVAGAGERLGAPGPENSGSPVQTNLITVALLDSSVGGPAPPNRVRNGSDNPYPGITNAGTMSIRRRVINHTGAPVSRLRFRISEMTTAPAAPGSGHADLRALTGMPISNVTVTNDSGTCGGSSSCTVTVEATTLEEPPGQATAGGGLNATLTVTLGTPLAAGDHVLVHFYLGVRQTGLFRFYVVTETLP